MRNREREISKLIPSLARAGNALRSFARWHPSLSSPEGRAHHAILAHPSRLLPESRRVLAPPTVWDLGAGGGGPHHPPHGIPHHSTGRRRPGGGTPAVRLVSSAGPPDLSSSVAHVQTHLHISAPHSELVLVPSALGAWPNRTQFSLLRFNGGSGPPRSNSGHCRFPYNISFLVPCARLSPD